jgi:uncharacterized SAM-binding protein YcdF (DUF218 family)
MEIELIYIIKALLLPPTIFLLLGVFAVCKYRRPYSRSVVMVSLIALILCSMPVIVEQLAKQWETIPVLDREQVKSIDPQAIVVLGGGIERSSPEYNEPFMLKRLTMSRVRYAGKLAKEIGLPVLVTGGAPLKKDRPSEAELMTRVLQTEFSIDVRWQEQQSRNSEQNARYSRKILKQEGIDRIVLVTHAYHMKRALHQFKRNGFKVLPAPTSFISPYKTELSIFSFLPSATSMEDCYLIAHEWLGELWYSLRYR